MVFIANNNKLSKKFAGKRVGQAQFNANAMNGFNANAFNAANANSIFTGNFVEGGLDATNPSGDVMRSLAAFDANQLNENQTLNQIEAETDLDIDVALNPSNNDRVLVVTDGLSGAQVVANMPAPQVVVPQDDVCEFPAQSVDFTRDVTITNSNPEILNVETDICGNVIRYTEGMTRSMNASRWVPTSPAQLSGPVRQFSVNNQGTVINGSGNVRLANSPGLNGFSVQPQVIPGPLVGGRRTHNSNMNAARGSQWMSQWRGQ